MTLDDFARAAIIITLCVVVVIVFGTLCFGLFDPRVSNDDIFKMLGHAFDMTIVALTGYLGGRASGAPKKDPAEGA